MIFCGGVDESLLAELPLLLLFPLDMVVRGGRGLIPTGSDYKKEFGLWHEVERGELEEACRDCVVRVCTGESRCGACGGYSQNSYELAEG